MRKRSCLDFDWRFSLGDFPTAIDASFDDSSWRTLDLPHDWSIEATPDPACPSRAAGGFFPGGLGWYRKTLDLPRDLGDRRVLIEFDGVFRNSEVWCNGRFAGRRPYGYSSFCYDLTPFIVADKPNVVAVRVDNSRQPGSRWYGGSGIYRHVWLTLASPVRVAHWGTFVTTPQVTKDRASVRCQLTLTNDRREAAGVEVVASVVEDRGGSTDTRSHTPISPSPGLRRAQSSRTPGEGRGEGLVEGQSAQRPSPQPSPMGTWERGQDQRPLASHSPMGARPTERSHTKAASVPANGSVVVEFGIELPSPRLWSPESPSLYTLRVQVREAGNVIDEYDTRFGVRTICFDADHGFFLNEQNITLKGVNEHHDAGCLGAAIPQDVLRRRLRILKDMGCNAIRTAHNPASPTLLDLCDEMGFMVVEEAFDEWKDGKTPFGYQLDWDQWWERDLVDMIQRDRNHPSIVLWSVGNEIKEVRTGNPVGLPIMKALQEVCHREDPTRPMTCGCCNSRETLAAGYQQYMDVFGYNGGGGGCFDYEKDHARFPQMCMIATEHPHTLQTRGVYRTRSWYRDLARNPNVERMEIPHLTETELFNDFDPHYQSSYGNAVVRMSIIDSWRRTSTFPYFAGEFRWTGFDYLGECYGWPAKSWNFGIIDLCGFAKDAYYLYQSLWTDKPMVHILPHWTWPGLEGKTIPVLCYTNCDRAELFLNGKSLGAKDRDDAAMQLRWDVTYQPGTLRVVGYRGGKQVATSQHTTAGAPSAIRLAPDEWILRADRTGIAHVAVSIVDKDGNLVPSANIPVSFRVEGAARLIGLENGDPLDTSNYKLATRRTFHGQMLAIVEAADRPGSVTITASADGLPVARCGIEARD